MPFSQRYIQEQMNLSLIKIRKFAGTAYASSNVCFFVCKRRVASCGGATFKLLVELFVSPLLLSFVFVILFAKADVGIVVAIIVVIEILLKKIPKFGTKKKGDNFL
ncbi:hypothetical protein DERP_006002 [Dermatophagoides pteronyssinus]|uniref:Uncharacterized protein n=1 Tax=Dermatophagoides pteronyssinus TaxID=6956 RepID=A0ABQ8JS04_DERPT|nr:hypothetical protein DERP_006002 [Dermatophagoides pteronyssinus]